MYDNNEHQTLYLLLQNPEFRAILIYLVCRIEYKNLEVINNHLSIEIWNNQVTIVIVLSGLINKEYLVIKNIRSIHFITFSRLLSNESTLGNISIKFIDPKEWFNEIIKRSKNEEIKMLNELNKLKINSIGDSWRNEYGYLGLFSSDNFKPIRSSIISMNAF